MSADASFGLAAGRGDLVDACCALLLAAAATTSAPRRASSSAIARPMPRDAPVTIATLPANCAHDPALNAVRLKSVDAGEMLGRLDVDERGSRAILRPSPRQHRAGPDLDERGDALGDEPAHDVLPAHRRRHLTDQRLDRGGRIGLRLAHRRWRRRARAARALAAPAARAPGAPRPASSARSGTAR